MYQNPDGDAPTLTLSEAQLSPASTYAVQVTAQRPPHHPETRWLPYFSGCDLPALKTMAMDALDLSGYMGARILDEESRPIWTASRLVAPPASPSPAPTSFDGPGPMTSTSSSAQPTRPRRSGSRATPNGTSTGHVFSADLLAGELLQAMAVELVALHQVIADLRGDLADVLHATAPDTELDACARGVCSWALYSDQGMSHQEYHNVESALEAATNRCIESQNLGNCDGVEGHCCHAADVLTKRLEPRQY